METAVIARRARLRNPRQAEKRENDLKAAVEGQRDRLLSVIRNLIRDQAEAEDVFQEVFEEYVEAYDLGQAIEALGAWLVRVARNKIFDRFRRRKTQNAYREAAFAEGKKGSASQPDDEEWARSLLRSELVTALGQLSPEQREVFVKHELEGKSFEKISAETGVNVNTLLSRKRYAVLFLRDYLKEIYDELE